MGADWMPEAERDGHGWTCNSMHRNTWARRVVLHWTASSMHSSPQSQANYMWDGGAGKSSGYHLLVPLISDYKPLQLRPASCAAGSLYNSGRLARSPNREGTVLIQISMVCTTGDDPFTRGPGPWWPAVLAWLDGWQIPRQYVDRAWNDERVMGTDVWYSMIDGWTAHKQVPEIPGTVRKPDPGPVTDSVLWPAPPSQRTRNREDDMLIANEGQVFLLSGGSLIYVNRPESLPGLVAVLGEPAEVDEWTWAAMVDAYGQPHRG